MKGDKNYFKEIVNYYNSSQPLYRAFIYNTNSLGMHFGFWDKKTKNERGATINTNRELIKLGNINGRDVILDAGCGVGGTAIYVSKNTGARVVGITLVQKQVDLAKYYAKMHKVDLLTDFQVQDYSKTNFPNNYFDVVYGIESICYSYPKERFLKEAYRVLKPSGRLIVIDGYTIKDPKKLKDKKRLTEFNMAFSIKQIITKNKFSDLIIKSKFGNLKVIDKTKEVLPSGLHYYNFGKRYFLLIKIFSYLPFQVFKAITRNYNATRLFYEFLKSGFGGYFVHYAEKL